MKELVKEIEKLLNVISRAKKSRDSNILGTRQSLGKELSTLLEKVREQLASKTPAAMESYLSCQYTISLAEQTLVQLGLKCEFDLPRYQIIYTAPDQESYKEFVDVLLAEKGLQLTSDGPLTVPTFEENNKDKKVIFMDDLVKAKNFLINCGLMQVPHIDCIETVVVPKPEIPSSPTITCR